MTSREKLIIDVDTGVDDAQALMMALRTSHDHDVIAVTCVAGNTSLDQVCINTLRVLRLCERSEVPVFRGAPCALVAKEVDADCHHGEGGLGGISDENPPSLTEVQKEHAVQALIRLVNENPNEITLVALAPLTNIALALKLYPEWGTKLKRAVIMGGNIEGRGNVTCCTEFNFNYDPEAAFIVLRELHAPSLQLLCWEPCVRNGLDWEWYNKLLAKDDTPLATFHAQITRHATNYKINILKVDKYYSCDPAAMAVAIYPDIALETKKVYCTVELQGSITRGQMVVDWRSQLGHAPNVELVIEVDIARLKKLYEKMLQ